ncbi:MAG: hypothetical protein HRT54_05840 [Colwellia sp.]|nr:hypothetical protein [Colwellia sp.]
MNIVKNVLILSLIFLLIACGGGGDSGSSVKPQSITNASPMVNAASDQTVDENSSVTLTGSASDSDGTIESYSWAQTGGTSVVLTNEDSATATFIAPDVKADETLTFTLSVVDNDGASSSDSIVITINYIPAELVITPTNTPSVLTEGTSSSFTFELTGVDGELSYNVEHDYLPQGSTVDVVITDTSLVVTINVAEEIYHNKTSTINIQLEDIRATQNQTVSWDMVLPIDNISGTADYEKYIKIMDALQRYVTLPVERNLVERLSQLASLINAEHSTANHASLQAHINSVTSNQARVGKFDIALLDLESLTSGYINGEVSEIGLTQTMDSLVPAVEVYAEGAYEVINDAVLATIGTVNAIPYNGVYISDDGAVISQFIGNQALGEFQQGAWVFGAKYAYLEAVVFPQSQPCNAE